MGLRTPSNSISPLVTPKQRNKFIDSRSQKHAFELANNLESLLANDNKFIKSYYEFPARQYGCRQANVSSKKRDILINQGNLEYKLNCSRFD